MYENNFNIHFMIKQCLVCCSVLSSRHGYYATLYPGYYI